MKRAYLITIIALLSLTGLSALTLSESLELAKLNNKSLLSAKEDIFMADQTYYQVRGYLLPQVTIQGGYQLNTTWLPNSAQPGRMDFSENLSEFASSDDSTLAGILTGLANSFIPSQPQKEGSLAAQAKLEQVLFSGGKLINGLNAVGRFRSIQKLRYRLQEQTLIAQTTDMFYQTILAQKVYAVQQEALDIASRHLQRVELLNREGQVSEYDMLRARLEVAKLKPNVVAAQNNYNLALSAFRNQIGYKDSLLSLEGDFVLPETRSEDLNTAQAKAVEQRIELQLTDINTEIMKIKYNAERGNYLPNVGLSASYSLFTAADEYAIENDDFGTSLSLGIGFSIPLFTGFTNTAKRSYAKHEYYQSVINADNTKEMIELEVKQAWQNLQYALENYKVQSENINLAERSVQLAQVRFENQVGIQLEVFDAQITLNSVKLGYYNSIFEVISANQKLTKAMGYNL